MMSVLVLQQQQHKLKNYFKNKTHITLVFGRAKKKKKKHPTYSEKERNMPNVWNIMDIENISSLQITTTSDIKS